jgi:hypothetical protein
MRPPTRALAGIAAAAVAATAAQAQSLTVVEVNAPAVNCVFNASCTVTVNDSTGALAMPFITPPGSAWLQSRTYPGAPGTPAAGKTAYVYRLSMTQAAGHADCVKGLVLNFGPVTKLPYAPGTLADVFVVTTGGLGTIGIASAQKTGDVIEFTFKGGGLCLSGGADVKNTTFFFGLAAATPPMATNAHFWAVGSPAFYEAAARVPTH